MPRIKYRKKFFLLMAILFPLSGCFSAPEHPEIRYFTPTLEPASARDPIALVLTIAPFRVAPHLTGDRIAARVSESEVEYYSRFRWAGALDQVIAREVHRFFRPAFAQTLEFEATGSADLVLNGTLEFFEEVDEPGRWFGLVGLNLSLVSSETGEPVWSAYFEEKGQATARNPESVVDSLRAVLRKMLSTALEEWKILFPPESSPDEAEDSTTSGD